MQTMLLNISEDEEKPSQGKSCMAMVGLLLILMPATLELHASLSTLGQPSANMQPSSYPPLFEQSNLSALATFSNTGCLPNPHPVVPIFQAQCPAESHYCFDEKGLIKWEPVPKCFLPPPQPFWMISGGTTCKGIGMGLIFWTRFVDEPDRYGRPFTVSRPKAGNLWVVRAVAVFTVSNLVVSVATLVWKAFWMEGFESWWDHTQCWGIMLSTAPWGQNFLLYGLKYILNEDPKSDSEAKKETFWTQLFLCASLGFGFLVLNGFFEVTNVLPALLGYIPFTIVPMLVMAAVSYAVFLAIAFGFEEDEMGYNLLPLVAIPFAILTDMLNQWMAVASIYLYHGDGYLQSLWAASTERQSNIYMSNMVDQILHSVTWCSQMVNELLP